MNGSTFQKIQLIFIFYGPLCNNCSKNFTANVPSSLWLAIDQFDMAQAIPWTMQLKNCLCRPIEKKSCFDVKRNMRSNILNMHSIKAKKVSNCAGNYKMWANFATLFQAKKINRRNAKTAKLHPSSLHLSTFEMGRCT